MEYLNDMPIVRTWSELFVAHRGHIRNRRQVYGFYSPVIIGYGSQGLPFRKLTAVGIETATETTLFYETFVQSATVQRFLLDAGIILYDKKRKWSSFNPTFFAVSLAWLGSETLAASYRSKKSD